MSAELKKLASMVERTQDAAWLVAFAEAYGKPLISREKVLAELRLRAAATDPGSVAAVEVRGSTDPV